ncbi:MAG: UvrD-helicase domain-containing protein [Actinomycetota bacterium]|nr:UvrD-helicase domain-containing protein [Actinomycetota bacterium]
MAEKAPFKPTDEQARAIATRKGNIFVSAAAGSGKTKAMTERFAEAVIKDNTPIERILTITFTNEAASQLQEKIRNRLAEAGMIDESRMVPDAYISTIHSFCTRILRAYPFAAGLDPHFTVLEEVAAKTLGREAIDEAIDEFANTDEERLEFVYQAGKNALAEQVIKLHETLRCAGHFNPADGMPANTARPRDKASINGLIDVLKGAVADTIANASRDSTLTTYLANFDILENLLEYLDVHGYDLRPGLGVSFKLKMNADISKEVFGPIKGLIDTIDEQLAEDLAHHYQIYYSELVAAYADIFKAKKEQVSGLDFEDLQLHVKDLFERHPDIKESYRSRFDMIMVDEFQDTNRLQCAIIDLIVDDNRFTVGDEFQSIYLFRNADVSVFRGLRENTRSGEGEDISFPTNFRSRENILRFVNRIGTSERFFGLNHLELVPGRDTASFNRNRENIVELAIVDETWKNDENENAISPAQAEARYIARRINEILAEGVYKHDDIAILIPKRTNLSEIEDALKLYDVDYYTVGGVGYYEADETAEIKDVLAVLVNPYDDISLIGALRGPCLRLSDDALYMLRKAAGKINGNDTPLWNGVRNGVVLPGPEMAKLDAFVETLRELRWRATHMRLSSLIELTIETLGYDLCALMRDHTAGRRYSNIKKFMRLADSYEDVHGPDLADFVDYLKLQKTLSGKEGEAAFADEDIGAVRIMTVHAAKGLQFPVVFLALSKSGASSVGGPILYQGEKGLPGYSGASASAIAFKVAGISENFDGPGYDGLKALKKHDSDEESRRLLHVGMTRAEEMLVLTSICHIDKKNPGRSTNNSYIEWLMNVLGHEHVALKANRDSGNYSFVDENGMFQCRIVTPEANPELKNDALLQNMTERKKADADTREIRFIDISALDSGLNRVIDSLSYSAIKNFIECPYRFYLQRIVGVERDERTDEATFGTIAPAEFGTIVHEALETLDFKGLLEDSATAIEQAVEACALRYPSLSTEDAARIATILNTYADSPIAQRLANAQVLQRETPFSFLLGDTVISGKLDVLADVDGRTLIVDYKTGSKGMSGAELADKYGLQMDLYALALLKSGTPEVEVIVAALENDGVAGTKMYTTQDIETLEGKLLEIILDLNDPAQKWARTVADKNCVFCDVSRFCGRTRPTSQASLDRTADNA